MLATKHFSYREKPPYSPRQNILLPMEKHLITHDKTAYSPQQTTLLPTTNHPKGGTSSAIYSQGSVLRGAHPLSFIRRKVF